MAVDPVIAELLRGFFNQDPQAAAHNIFGPMMGRNNNYGEWLRGNVGNWFNQYKGQLDQNPEMQLIDYFKTINPMQMFQSLAPRQRGENPAAFSPGVKYLDGGRF